MRIVTRYGILILVRDDVVSEMWRTLSIKCTSVRDDSRSTACSVIREMENLGNRFISLIEVNGG